MAGKRLLVSIVGPTGSGKSDLAVSLALALDGEIVNCDSVQLYRDLNIGSGKPSPSDLDRVRHHLLGFVPLTGLYSAGQMQREARAAIESIASQGAVPILTGGTGFYSDAVLFGLPPAPARSSRLRDRLARTAENRGEPFLVKMLRRVDPKSAERIMPRDRMRIVRALEVYFLSGVPLSQFRRSDIWLDGFRWVGFALEPNRSELYGRIDARVRRMLQNGWIDEVRRLLDSGADPACKAFDAIGYRDVIAHLAGELDREALEERISRRTRQYAKRQLTWFRRETRLLRLVGFGDDPSVVDEALRAVQETR